MNSSLHDLEYKMKRTQRILCNKQLKKIVVEIIVKLRDKNLKIFE